MTLLLAALVFVNAAALPFVLFVWLPRCLRSTMRYRLWSLRDKLWDARQSGKVQSDSVAAENLLQVLETSIKYPEAFSVTCAIPNYLSVRLTAPERLLGARDEALRDMKLIAADEADSLLISIAFEYGSTITRYSTLGWSLKLLRVFRGGYRSKSPGDYKAPATQGAGVTGIAMAVDAARAVGSSDRKLSSCIG